MPDNCHGLLPRVRLSIIIVNWNTQDLLRRCLHSIYASYTDPDLEVIIIDNGSTDNSVAMVKKRFPQIVLVENKSNVGFAAANNQGIRIATGDFILLLNSDTEILGKTLQACLAYMGSHPKVGVLGCRVVNADRTFQSSYFRFMSLLELFLVHCLGFLVFVVLVEKLGAKDFNFPSRYWGKRFLTETEVDAVAGCFLLTRQNVIAQVGPLDQDFFFYGEEEEWCFRIKRAGWVVVYYPLVEIVHVHGASSTVSPLSLGLFARKGRLTFLAKTRGVYVAWLGNLAMSLGLLLRMPLYFVVAFVRFFRRNKGRGQPRLTERFEWAKFHFMGIFRPVW